MIANQLPPRSQWLRYWTAIAAGRIRDLACDLARCYRIDDLETPQSGLALLPLHDGALGQAYFLGETPLARARVRLTDAGGASVEGAAIVMDDRASLASALAILDGIVAAAWPGHEAAIELLREGQQEVARIESDRKKLLASTRVDFSLLGAEEDADA